MKVWIGEMEYRAYTLTCIDKTKVAVAQKIFNEWKDIMGDEDPSESETWHDLEDYGMRLEEIELGKVEWR